MTIYMIISKDGSAESGMEGKKTFEAMIALMAEDYLVRERQRLENSKITQNPLHTCCKLMPPVWIQ